MIKIIKGIEEIWSISREDNSPIQKIDINNRLKVEEKKKKLQN